MQALVPPIFIFPPIILYGFQHFKIFDTIFSEYIVFLLAAITPCVNAILTIYCVKPYRDSLIRIINMKSNEFSTSIKNRTFFVSTRHI